MTASEKITDCHFLIMWFKVKQMLQIIIATSI